MITGVETAGLVLAAIPLLISALEHYNETKRAVSRFFGKPLYLKQLVGALAEQEVFLENEIDYMLRLAGFEDAADTVTVVNCVDLLKDAAVVESLQEELGRSYDAYLRALDRSREAIIDIASRIKGLMKDVSFTLEDLATVAKQSKLSSDKFEFRNRLKVAMNMGDIEARIDDLDESMKKMIRLRMSSRVPISESSPLHGRSHQKLCEFLRAIRHSAQIVHQALAASLSSGCHNEHVVRLYLDPRANIKPRQSISFRVSLSGSPSSHDATPSQEILHIEKLDPVNTLPHTTRIRFSNAVQQSGQSASTTQDPASQVLISNLCSTLSSPRSPEQEWRLYFEEPSILRGALVAHRNISRHWSQSLTTSSLSLSLNEVIEHFSKSTANERARFWTLQQRLRLSATLASSTLQLCTTPWIRDVYSTSSVHFHAAEQDSTASQSSPLSIIADNPFVIEKVSTTSGGQRAARGLDMNEDVLELGISLLEIWHGRQFVDWTTEMLSCSPTSFTERAMAAKRWLDSTAQDVLPFYLNAVATCVEGAASQLYLGSTWDDSKLPNIICGSVVQPLIQACAS